MEQAKYDVFISYRREGGGQYARIIQQALEKHNYQVFLDYDELNDGNFNQRILDAIKQSSVFLLILTKGALDRCIDENDWVRREILQAMKCDCHIVPVNINNTFVDYPPNLPEELRLAVGQHQFSEVQMTSLFKDSMRKLVSNRIEPYVHNEVVATGVEIHIEVDADCDLFRFTTFMNHLKAYEDNVVYLPAGEYKLNFISTQMRDVQKVLYPYVVGSDISCTCFKMDLQQDIDKAIARQKAEEEAKRQAEEVARRKAEEEAHRKAEALRRAKEVQRKAEEEARRKAEEEARRKKEIEEQQKMEALLLKIKEEEDRRHAEEADSAKREKELFIVSELIKKIEKRLHFVYFVDNRCLYEIGSCTTIPQIEDVLSRKQYELKRKAVAEEDAEKKFHFEHGADVIRDCRYMLEEYKRKVRRGARCHLVPVEKKRLFGLLKSVWGYKYSNEDRMRWVIPCKWRYAENFSEGLAAVANSKRMWGYIDTEGNEVIPCQYGYAHNFSGGLAAVRINFKWGFIDKSGNVAFLAHWDEVDDFHEGLARVAYSSSEYNFLNKKGGLISNHFWRGAWRFSCGLAAVMNEGGKWGFVDKNGKEVIPYQWKQARPFIAGLAFVQDKKEKWGLIDRNGNIVIPCKWESSKIFGFDNLDAYTKHPNGTWGYVRKDGKEIVTYKWTHNHQYNRVIQLESDCI